MSVLLRRSLSAFCVFTVELSKLAGQVAPGTQSDEGSSNNLCGVHCLYLATKSLGDDSIALDALRAEFGEPSAGGYSMEQIRQIANAHGLQTLAVSTTLESLAARETPFACIAHLTRGHFVLIADIDPTGVLLVDPPLEVRIPEATFESQWNGDCLLISKRPLASEAEIQHQLWVQKVLYRVLLASVAVLAAFSSHRLWSAFRMRRSKNRLPEAI